jgi:hypothetical protein
MNVADRLYERLTPLERLRAIISAKARGDSAERERLVGTCERKTYNMLDAGLIRRADCLHLVALAHAADVNRTALMGMTALTCVLAIEDKLSDDAELSEEQEQDWRNYEKTGEACQTFAARVEGWERAFDRFCEALGFDACEVRISHGITRVQLFTEDSDNGFDLPVLIAVHQPDPTLIDAATEERFELYRKVWLQEFPDIGF